MVGFESEKVQKAAVKWSTDHKGSSWFRTYTKQMCVSVHNDWLCMQTRVQKVFLLDFIHAYVWASFFNWGSKEVSMATTRMDPYCPSIAWVASLSWELAVPFFHLAAWLEENSSGEEVLDMTHRKKEIIHWFSVLSIHASGPPLVTFWQSARSVSKGTIKHYTRKTRADHATLIFITCSLAPLTSKIRTIAMTILANLTDAVKLMVITTKWQHQRVYSASLHY